MRKLLLSLATVLALILPSTLPTGSVLAQPTQQCELAVEYEKAAEAVPQIAVVKLEGEHYQQAKAHAATQNVDLKDSIVAMTLYYAHAQGMVFIVAIDANGCVVGTVTDGIARTEKILGLAAT